MKKFLFPTFLPTNCDDIEKNWNSDETQIVMKHTLWWNTSCDEKTNFDKYKFWWNTSCEAKVNCNNIIITVNKLNL